MSPKHKPSPFERSQDFWLARQQECAQGLAIANQRLDIMQPETQLQLFTLNATAKVLPFPRKEKPADIVA